MFRRQLRYNFEVNCSFYGHGDDVSLSVITLSK